MLVLYFLIPFMSHLIQPETAVNHREDFYFSERQHYSYYENRCREDMDFDRNN